MAWIKAANGNVFEVEDPDLVAKVLKDGIGEDGKPTHTAWQTDPREKGAKAYKEPPAEPAAE